MQPFIIRYIFCCLTLLSITCKSQNRKYDLTDDQYELYINGYRKSNTEPEHAIMLLDSLLKVKPNFCQALAPLGYSHFKMKNLSQAKQYYFEAIECDPTKPFSYHQLSKIYQEERKYDSAELVLLNWTKYEQLDFDKLRTEYSELAKITRAKNQYHKSIEYLNEAINRCYDGNVYKYCDNLFYLRADSYSIIGEPEKAWEDILVHEKLNPDDRATLVLKGEILQLLEKYEESTAILKEYLMNPTNKGENWVNYMIGYNYNRIKEFEKSCIYLKEAARLRYEDEILNELLKDCNE